MLNAISQHKLKMYAKKKILFFELHQIARTLKSNNTMLYILGQIRGSSSSTQHLLSHIWHMCSLSLEKAVRKGFVAGINFAAL